MIQCTVNVKCHQKIGAMTLQGTKMSGQCFRGHLIIILTNIMSTKVDIFVLVYHYKDATIDIIV